MRRRDTGTTGEQLRFCPNSDSKPTVVRPGDYEWPELRVARLASWDGMDNEMLDWFLLNCGAKNRRRGTVRVVSQIACTYIRDTEMRGMILAKRPDLQSDPRKAAAVYRGIGRSLKGYMRGAERDIREHERAVLDGERFGAATGLSGPAPSSRMWQHTKFEIAGQEIFGRLGLGFALDGNPEFGAERDALLEFLRKEEKLDTSRVDPDWRPHAVFFDVRPNLATQSFVMDYPVAGPTSLVLCSPGTSMDV